LKIPLLNECGTGIFCLQKKFLCLFFFKKLKKREGICIMDTDKENDKGRNCCESIDYGRNERHRA
jgi:hypothetical protein